MRLDKVLEEVEVLDETAGCPQVEITRVDYDSRKVREGSLFCCVPGAAHDGHDFAADAARAGARALMVERTVPVDVHQVLVAGGTVRLAMAEAAAALHGHPSRSLVVLGVTGTNGKTTVTHMLRSIFDQGGARTGVVGTLGGSRTTPESPVLQEILGRFRDEGRRVAALEVSSHAAVQGRVEAIDFDVVGFTNLTREHLDFHGGMQDYFDAKARLFSPERARVGVANADDEWGRKLLRTQPIPVHPFSIAEAEDLELSGSYAKFSWRGNPIRLAMRGKFNVANALAAATMAELAGAPVNAVVGGLSAMPSVPGRMETVDAGQPFTVIVDYAHTPAGLSEVLAAARNMAVGRVIVVFGCGGDRDRTKRPEMGAIAVAGADLAVVTSDNPRSEDPGEIIAEVVSGVTDRSRLRVEPDRADAIGMAVGEAERGDVVVLAGKGHETQQELGERTVDFDDRVVARAALERLAGGRP